MHWPATVASFRTWRGSRDYIAWDPEPDSFDINIQFGTGAVIDLLSSRFNEQHLPQKTHKVLTDLVNWEINCEFQNLL